MTECLFLNNEVFTLESFFITLISLARRSRGGSVNDGGLPFGFSLTAGL